MNVDSFSQLPFIQGRHKPPPLRLFGIDFDDDNATATAANKSDHYNSAATTSSSTDDDIRNESSSGTLRRFECHYCCRNFPTSQALGGHQNAHKRERQHAKRAHLHSAAADAARIYGFFDYHAGNPPTHHRTTSFNYNSRAATLVNGSPVGVWRIPPGSNWERSSLSCSSRLPMSAFPPREESQSSQMISGRASPQNNRGYVYEDPRLQAQDHVISLDLHL